MNENRINKKIISFLRGDFINNAISIKVYLFVFVILILSAINIYLRTRYDKIIHERRKISSEIIKLKTESDNYKYLLNSYIKIDYIKNNNIEMVNEKSSTFFVE